jgi:hypothetical protein
MGLWAPDPEGVTKAIASFMRTMVSGESRYDRFQRGDTTALTEAERRGKELFFSERARWAVTGERLTLTAPTGESLTLKRVQRLGGGRAIYGQWLLADEPLVRGIMQITATSVTSIAACKTPDGRQATASAVSPARITDTEIEILESHEERLTFSEPLVDDAVVE